MMIFELFEQLLASEKTPHLLGDKDSSLSRLETRRLVDRIACAIDRFTGGMSQSAVAILLPRNNFYLASIFSTWQTGNYFIPLNVSWPPEHLLSILRTAKPDLVIVEDGKILNEFLCLPITEATTYFSPSNDQRKYWEVNRAGPGLAYVIFTSGSTGEQKGVMISRSAYGSYISWTKEYFSDFAENKALLITAELTFDITLGDIAFALAFDTEIHVSPESRNIFFHAKMVRDRRIDTFYSVPSTISRVFKFVENRNDIDFSGIRLIMAGGDIFGLDLIETVKRVAPLSAFYNVYGPTEVTINCCAVRVDDRVEEIRAYGSVPIGFPFPHLKHRILDLEDSNLDSPQSGELLIGGTQCMDGYLDDQSRTEKAFISLSGERYYRTGDLVEIGQNNLLYVLGRIDQLIKIKGYRVSPLQIDNTLSEDDRVVEARTVAVRSPVGDTTLVSIVVASTEPSSQVTEHLMSLCRLKLPWYMVPARIVYIDTLPLGTSGKYDTRALEKIATKLIL